MMSNKNTVLKISNYAIMDIFDKKAKVNYREFSDEQYESHKIYFELCITLALKNRMGILNMCFITS